LAAKKHMETYYSQEKVADKFLQKVRSLLSVHNMSVTTSTTTTVQMNAGNPESNTSPEKDREDSSTSPKGISEEDESTSLSKSTADDTASLRPCHRHPIRIRNDSPLEIPHPFLGDYPFPVDKN
jgi:hypothetical protein